MLLLDRIKDRAAAFGVYLTPMLESGSVYETILNAAKEKNVDIIVIGTTRARRSGTPASAAYPSTSCTTPRAR